MTGERAERPWGSYTVLEDAPTHKVKRIEVRSGCRLYFGEDDIERLDDDFDRVG